MTPPSGMPGFSGNCGDDKPLEENARSALPRYLAYFLHKELHERFSRESRMEEPTLAQLQAFLGYQFNDVSLLVKAFIAPGAEGNSEGSVQARIQYEGNRYLADIGGALHQLAVKRLILEGVPRGQANDLLQKSYTMLEERAKTIGFHSIIKLNPRQRGVVNAKTLRLVFSAIVGAVYEDCGRNESAATDAVNCLYIIPLLRGESNNTTSLRELEMTTESQMWNDWIDIPETPTCSWSQSGFGTLLSEHTGNASLSTNSVSPQSTFQVAQLADSDRSSSPIQIRPRTGSSTPNEQFEIEIEPEVIFDDDCASMEYMLEQPTNSTSQGLDLESQYATGEPTAYQTLMTAAETGAAFPSDAANDMISEQATATIDSHGSSSIELACVQRPTQQATGASRPRKWSFQDKDFVRVHQYVEQEKQRCLISNTVFTDMDLELLFARTGKSRCRVETWSSTLLTLFFGVASPEMLANLLELLKTRRERPLGAHAIEKHNLSLPDRMMAIDRADANVAYSSFRKRCHILQLYLDCNNIRTANPFVTSSPQSIASGEKVRMGNPDNLGISDLEDIMLGLLYPNLEPDSPMYRQKKDHVCRMRRFGQRLKFLVEKFGYGILGLIPLPISAPSFLQALNLTDELILRIPDHTFVPFAEYLDEILGPILRSICVAVKDVVEAIFNEERDLPETFAMERCELPQILRLPRGSSELLELISERGSYNS